MKRYTLAELRDGTGFDRTLFVYADVADEALAALALAVTALGGYCLVDVLNPCWNARPNDVTGQHWGGGKACAVCTARAVIAKAVQS
jgi:hypothetical protein